MQRAALSGLCLLGVVGCSVVVEGKGDPDDTRGQEQPPALGGVQGGAGEPGALAGGPVGAVAGGGQAGGLPGAPGGEGGEPGGPGMLDPALPRPACTLHGTFALDFQLSVFWAGTMVEIDLPVPPVPLLDPGEGVLSFVLLGKFLPSVDGVQGTVRVCDAIVPDFSASLLGEHYAPRFDESIWDSISMPSFSFRAGWACDEDGCMWKSQQIHAQLGAQLDNPAGAWPTNAAAAFWPDHDGDRQPGITAQMLGPGAYNVFGEAYHYPPVHPLALRRINKLMLGLRMQLLLKLLQQPDCNHIEGVTAEASVDSRAVNCASEIAPLECSGSELLFMDENLPAWAVNMKASTIRGVRMEENADCAAARRARADFR
jgi:hypothetical protein